MRRIPKYFVKGLLFFVPFVVTIYAIGKTFSVIDGMLRNFFNIGVPGLGFALGVVLLTGIGFLTTNMFTRGILNFVDLLFRNVPFVRLVYNSIRDLIDAFVGKKNTFARPVLVTVFPESGGKALGFITNEALEHLALRDHVVVYFPQSYNFAGQTLIFPKDRVTPIRNVASSELMTFIVSAGIAGRHDMLQKEAPGPERGKP